MKHYDSGLKTSGIIGYCGGYEVFLGFEKASTLFMYSFADVLDEETGLGYQRSYNRAHSLDFQRYIQLESSSTIPLTFNIRAGLSEYWSIEKNINGTATLSVKEGRKVLARVDCQHRIGELSNVDVSLAFMSFIGLDLRGEMALFTIINSKAKGLSSSLTDFHQSTLLQNMAADAPNLFIARKLNEDPYSPWNKQIRYGGETTSGLKRRTSFRMMQKTIQHFIKDSGILDWATIDDTYSIVVTYWLAIQKSFEAEWKDHRHHLISKGIGLYSLFALLTEIIKKHGNRVYDLSFFQQVLQPLREGLDWGSNGTFADSGGQKGANMAFNVLKELIKL
jgi:DNA sulfur modification protein DndB